LILLAQPRRSPAMPSELECYVYVVLPGSTEFVTAGRFSQSRDPQGQPVGTFVYGRRYRERADAVELDPVQLRLRQGPFLSLPTSRCPSVD
jgi:serine/threonine-protein kinase HipA